MLLSIKNVLIIIVIRYMYIKSEIKKNFNFMLKKINSKSNDI